MDNHVDRRFFAKQASLAMGGLVMGAIGHGCAAGPEGDSPPYRLVTLGLNAMARAHERDYFADGHRGASLVAAHFLCVDNELDERARARIAQLFDLNWASSPLCKPFPETDPEPERVTKIGEALLEGAATLREAGHNAIFAMLAIKAFRLLPRAATRERIDGVCALVRSFKPWHDVEPDHKIEVPPFTEHAAAASFILKEASAAVDRFVGFGQGFSGHMLTFGQALIELAAMGDVELAESCRAAYRKYVTFTRRGPEPGAKRLPDHSPSTLRPTQADYWEKRGDHAVDIGHVFKYPYGYYDLLRRANDPALTSEWEAKAYHLF